MGTSYNPRIVTDGLVLCLDAANKRSYPGSGSTWNDLSKQGNNGTLINGPTFSNEGNGSILCDGMNDYINVSNFNEDSNQDLSVIVWVYPVTLGNLTTGGFDYSWLINKRDNSDDKQWQMFFRSIEGDNDFFLRLSIYDDTAGTQTGLGLSSTTEIFINQWYQCGFTFNSSNSEGNLYINGVYESSDTLGGTGNRKTGSRDLVISKTAWDNTDYLNANISSVQIYNKVLSEQEIKQNYLATKGRFQ